jgi:putative membrane protein
MVRRVVRLLPVLAAAIAAAMLSTGSFALAGDHRGDHHKSGDWHRDNHHQGSHGKRFSAWDEEWLMMSIQGDRFEIAGGQLAQQKGTTQQVRDLGARLVADHSKSLQDAIDVANKLGIEVPDSPSPSQQWELRAVARFHGSNFDRGYSDLEVQDHIQDITEAEDEVDKGCNREIKQLAADDLPVLREHLALAQAALRASSH